MDPNSNVKEQRQIARAIVDSPDGHTHGAVRLAELVLALDEWICLGGFCPTEWSER